MANKIKLNLQSYTVPDKIQFMRQVVTEMTGNANFTTPSPALTVISTKATALESAFNAQQTAQQAAKTATTNLGTAEDAANAAMNSLANYVEETTLGDTAKIESAGMSTRAPKTPTTSLPAPGNLSSTAGDEEGELDLVWDPVPKAKGYEVHTSPDPVTSTSWAFAETSSASRTSLTGLPSGSKIWVRVRALGPKKIKSPWSDPAVKRVP